MNTTAKIVNRYVENLSTAETMAQLEAIVRSETADLSAIKAKIVACESPQSLYDMARYLVPYAYVKQEIDKQLNPDSRKAKELTAKLESAHAEFEKKCQDALSVFDSLYMAKKVEISQLLPRYRYSQKKSEEDVNFNMSEWNAFVDRFATKYGDWFYEIRLRHDPLDDMNYGSISIHQALNYTYGAWYESAEFSTWVNLPYGAKLFKLHGIISFDLVLVTMVKTGVVKESDIPSREFRQYVDLS